MRDIQKRQTNIKLIEFQLNRGKGEALKEGFIAAYTEGYSHALQIDSDGQHNLNDIPTFLNTTKTRQSALIYGNPKYDVTIPKGRFFFRYITHFCVSIETLSFRIIDTMCGLRFIH